MTTTVQGLATQLVVGLEIHVELATRSKMWTDAPNVAHPDYHDAEPNTLLDPVVIGMPGTLPVMNRAAVEMSIKVGLALGCEIASHTKWDRKGYYYPDLPKSYQISQYDKPLCGQGSVELPGYDPIRITRAHLEEDAGKLLHEAPGGRPIDYSIVDLNRAGTPLLEIVTEPDFHDADHVVAFCQHLRDLCRHLGVTEGIMQMGHIRFEPNINVIIEKDGETYKTPVVEIKNLNSFKAVHGAITHEHGRQVDEWLKTGNVMGARAKSTRGWDDAKLVTTVQRTKEDADEYRYFPDPDLVDLLVDEEWLETIKADMPMLVNERETAFAAWGLDEKIIRQLLDDPRLCDFLEAAAEAAGDKVDPARVTALLLNAGAKLANEQGKRIDQLGISPQQAADIAGLTAADKISSTAAATLFGQCCISDAPAEQLAETHGLLQVSDDGQLDSWIDAVLANPKNEKIVVDIREGKDKAIGALLGQIMQLSKGQANPKVVGDKIKTKVRG